MCPWGDRVSIYTSEWQLLVLPNHSLPLSAGPGYTLEETQVYTPPALHQVTLTWILLQQPDLELDETMSEVAAVLTQAAITHFMSAHVKLEVLLELADLGVFQGSGTHDVDQTPAARPEKQEAPEDQIFTPSSLYVTFRHLTGQSKETENQLWERQTPPGKTKPLPSHPISPR